MLTQEERILLTEFQQGLLTMFEDEKLSRREIGKLLNIQYDRVGKEIKRAQGHIKFVRAKKVNNAADTK